MHRGAKSIGLDGKEYRSDLEKEFCDKFLFQKFQYKYEKSYNKSNLTCDFYIDTFKLWIEVVPYAESTFATEIQEDIPNKIYLTTEYKDRHLLKEAGASWDPNAKSWYIHKPFLPEFRRHVHLRRCLPKFDTITIDPQVTQEYKNFYEYKQNIDRKRSIIQDRGELFCVIYKSDLDYSSLMHILKNKGFDAWNFIGAVDILSRAPKVVHKVEYHDDVTACKKEVVAYLKSRKVETKYLTQQDKQLIDMELKALRVSVKKRK